MSRKFLTKAMFTKARMKGAAGVAGVAAVGLVIATIPGIATSASWVDPEWVSATQGTQPGVGTGTCEDPTFSTRGAATFLELDALFLDDTLTAGFLEATNDGTTSTSDPVTAPIGPNPPEVNQYLAGIDLGVLNGLISAYLDDIDLPLNTDLGVLASYAEAQPNGYSAAGSGLITSTGGLDLDAADDSDLEPLGTLDLATLVGSVLPGTSPLVNYLADLDLTLGAVGSEARLDACPLMWGDDSAENLVRDYLIAGLDLDIDSSLLGDIVTEVTDLLTDIESLRVTALADITAQINTVLGPLASGGLVLADLSINPTVTIDTSALATVLTSTYTGNGTVSLNLADGTIGLDLATLLGGPNGLNDLPPNTELLVDAGVLTKLQTGLTAAVGQLLTQLGAAIDTVVNSISLGGTVTANVDLLGVDIASVNINLGTGNVQLTLLDPQYCNLILNPLNTVTCGLITVLQTLLGTTVTALLPTLDGILTTLGTAVTSAINLVIGVFNLLDDLTGNLYLLLDALLDGLFDADTGLLSIVVNAQSAPTGNANPIPTNFQDPPVPAGQYDVAAIRIGVLDLLGPDFNVDLTLARSSVGQNIYIP